MAKLIHYYSKTDIQMMGYIIVTDENKVIFIDGGYRSDAEDFLRVAKEAAGTDKLTVDAWFLTHGHGDHVDVFFETVEKYWDEVDVKKIYCNFPSAQYFRNYEKWLKNVSVETFYELLPRFADRVCVVSAGDSYDIGSAKVDILYTCDDSITENIGNNSSIVFSLMINGKKIMFLADLGVEGGEKLLRVHGKNLKSDICQMAHHGQRGVERDVYEAINPEICLWDAPKWLWDNDMGDGFDTYQFETVKVRGWMEELGVKKNIVAKDGTQMLEL